MLLTPFEVRVGCGALRVFRASIPASLFERDAFDWLTPEDAIVALRMQGPRRRAQFAAGRWLLRHAVTQTFGARWSLRTQEGRPRVELASGPAAVSLSHSGDVVVCAAGRLPAIGIDVERIRPRRNWEALSIHVLHSTERAGLTSCSDPVRWERFYRAWTRKEAFAKALGMGVFDLAFDRILFEDGRLSEAPADQVLRPSGWRAREFDAGPGLAAAVAWHT
jgi:phosphopantetheinyl transferase